MKGRSLFWIQFSKYGFCHYLFLGFGNPFDKIAIQTDRTISLYFTLGGVIEVSLKYKFQLRLEI